MLQNIIKHSTLLILTFVLLSCGNNKEVSGDQDKLPKVKDLVLIQTLDSLSKVRPEHFYTKLSSKYRDSEYNVSFKTSIRMRTDSALHALITYARIPIYNTMVTPDTLTIVDKRGDCYIKEDMSYLKETFDINFEHKNIEELILGMPIGWSEDSEYFVLKDPYNYIVSSHSERNLRRMNRSDNADDLYIQYFLTKDAQQLEKVMIESPKDTTAIRVEYSGREMVNGFSIPIAGDIAVETPRDTITIAFKYNRTNVNDPRVLYLAIPEKYGECE
jgi:hypothetical protein